MFRTRFEGVAILLALIVSPALAQEKCPNTSAVATIPRDDTIRSKTLYSMS